MRREEQGAQQRTCSITPPSSLVRAKIAWHLAITCACAASSRCMRRRDSSDVFSMNTSCSSIVRSIVPLSMPLASSTPSSTRLLNSVATFDSMSKNLPDRTGVRAMKGP